MTGKEASGPSLRPNVWKRRLSAALGSLAVVAVCVAIRAIGGREEAGAQSPSNRATAGVTAERPARGGKPAPSPASSGTSTQQQVVAVVNGEEIHRQELAQQALAEYGKEVLESVMNKRLILNHCQKVGVSVSKEEIEEEISRLAQKFAIPVDQWLQMLEQERGIKPAQYANDIIWPTLALRKLAAERIQPTDEEIDEAYEAQFGAAVRARLIVVNDAATARKVHAQAQANPDEFGALARKHSTDPTSASLNGLIQPIRRHVGDPKLEQAAFALQEGDVSPVVEVNGQFAILKCEGHTQPSEFAKEQVRGRLEEFVRERKLRGVATDIFKQLQDQARVENVLNDPQKRGQMPGVAATINGQAITLRDLAEECIARHGETTLETMVHCKLLEQELKKRKLNVTQRDLDAEIARAAMAAGKVTKSGKPDVQAWLNAVTEEQGVPQDKYLRDSVWPSAALKLIAGDAEVTAEDIEKGYKANYGSRAQVRAIVLDSQRRAQEVWEKARDNPSLEFFGKLAEQYSVEPASRANEGRVPPIQQYGGQPELEKEAFSLQPGEVSGILQVMEKFVILYLEGFTDPVKVSREEVRDLIYENLHEKKQRLAMGREFDRLKDQARIDNFLAGSSHAPNRQRPALGSRVGSQTAGSKSPAPQAADRGVVPAGYNAPVDEQLPAMKR